jgi:hypothetical protein
MLNGVNYTYLQRGNCVAYNLDNCVLELSDDLLQMTGYNDDGKTKIPNIVYKRVIVH